MSNSLLEFVNETIDRLLLESGEPPELRSALESLRDTLEATYARYEPPAPAGAEAIREAMLECVDLYCGALDCLEKFLDTPNRKLLTLAAESAQEASDLLEQIEFSIEQNQEWVSQFQEC